jgi:hypothetical protein
MSRSNAAAALLFRRKGDGSTLSLDFTKMSELDSRFTFTRAGPATYINSSGYVATMAAAATNDPTKARLDYNPTTLAAKGLLIESAATNLTKRSDNAFSNAYWNTTFSNNVTAVDSAVTSPTGVALTASTLTENAGASVTRHIHQTTGEFTPTVATPYTMSAWVKQPASAAVRYVQLTFFTAGFGATAYMNYDIQAGTVGTGGAAITASTITAYPSGWYRITATAPATATGSSGFQLGFSTTSSAVRTESYTVTGGSEKAIYLWGAQVEAGKGASSYIPTVASQVTRAIDSCTFAVTPANISLQSAPPATICYSANVHAIPTSSFPTIIGFQDSGGTTQVFRSQINSTTSNYITWLPTGAASNQANEITYSTLAQGVSFKVATSITSTFVTASRNGVAATPVSVGATYSFGTPDKIAIGILASNAAFTIANFKFFPSAKSQAELNALST